MGRPWAKSMLGELGNLADSPIEYVPPHLLNKNLQSLNKNLTIFF